MTLPGTTLAKQSQLFCLNYLHFTPSRRIVVTSIADADIIRLALLKIQYSFCIIPTDSHTPNMVVSSLPEKPFETV